MDMVIPVTIILVFGLIWYAVEGTKAEKAKAEKAYEEFPSTVSEDKLERIYERCQERELKGFEEDSEKIIQVIRNITLNKQLDKKQAKEIYLLSMQHAINKALAEEQVTYEEEKLKSKIVGKDKYRYGLLEELDALENQLDNVGAVTNALSMGAMQPKSKNPVASATITGAILGPAAGVAAANKAQAQNAEAQDTYNRLQATLAESLRLEYQSAGQATKRVKAIKDYLKKIDEIEIDASNPNLYFGYIMFIVKNISVSKSHKFLALTIESDMADGWVRNGETVELPESFWDKYGNVDGSVKLIAKYDGSEIGTGYLCAPGFGGGNRYGLNDYTIEDIDYGFKCYHELEALIKLNGDWSKDWDVTKVQIEFEPINIWVRTR